MEKAAIEVNLNFRDCCSDEDGLSSLGTSKLEAGSCSERTCFYSETLAHSTWISKQKLPGCGCCQVNGKLIQDGFTWVEEHETFGNNLKDVS